MHMLFVFGITILRYISLKLCESNFLQSTIHEKPITQCFIHVHKYFFMHGITV